MLFQRLFGLTIYNSLFIPVYQTALRNIRPVESAKEASNLRYKLWENRDLNSAASNYRCLFGLAIVCILYITFQTVVL